MHRNYRFEKNTYCICHQLELCARQKYVHFLETNLKITFEIQAPLLSWSLLRPTWSFWTNLSNKSGRFLIWKSGSKLFSILKFNELLTTSSNEYRKTDFFTNHNCETSEFDFCEKNHNRRFIQGVYFIIVLWADFLEVSWK